MKKVKSFALCSLFVLLAQVAQSTQARSEEVLYNRKAALGVAFIQGQKSTAPHISFNQAFPELFGYAYYDLNDHFLFRPGLKVSYVSGQEATRTRSFSLGISETDIRSSAEFTLILKNPKFVEGYIMPAFSAGGGAVYRITEIETKSPVVSSQPLLNGSEFLPLLYGQFSLIVPIAEGRGEIVPFVRYTRIFSDDRLGWMFGAEGSITLF